MIWHLFARRYLATQVRMVVLVFCVAAAVAFALLVVAFRASTDEPMSAPVIIGLALTFAAIAASGACFVATIRIARCAQSRIDAEFPHRSAITDVVIRGHTDELSVHDRVLATKYAVALRPYLAFQNAQLVLICGGLLISQVAMAGNDRDGSNPYAWWAMALLLVTEILAVALWVVQSRKVHRYLERNQRLLGAPVL